MKLLITSFLLGLSLLTRAQTKSTAHAITDTLPIHNLDPVTVHTSTYKADSVFEREFYKNIFNYKKKKINMGDNKWTRTTVVMGKKIALKPQESLSLLDIDALIMNIHSKKNKQKLALQKRMIEQEQERYVLKVFTPALVERFSNMHDDDSIHVFIAKYAPSFKEIKTMNELDLGNHVLVNMKLFRQNHPANDSLNNN